MSSVVLETRVPHLRLRVLHVGTGHLQPGYVRCSQTSPVHEVQSQFPGGWFDEPAENVVVADRFPIFKGLENQVIGPFCLARFPHFDPTMEQCQPDPLSTLAVMQ